MLTNGVGFERLAVNLVNVYHKASAPPRDRCTEGSQPLYPGRPGKRVVKAGYRRPQIDDRGRE